MDTTNLSRTLKSLKNKNVIAERKHTKFMYVQHYFKWGKESKADGISNK